MKIVLEVYDNDTRIGATNDALDLARYGKSFGLEYLLCGPISGSLSAEADKLGLRTIPHSSRLFSRTGIVWYCLSVLEWVCILLVHRPDIVHINYTAWGPSLACAAKVLGIPVVLRAGALYNPKNLTFRWADAYVANCEAQASGLLNSPLCNRVRVVGDLVNMDRFSEANDHMSFSEAKNGTVKLLFLGQLVERKGIDTLVNALAKIDAEAKYVLYLVGGDWRKSGYPQDIRRQIDGLGLNDRVFLHNHRTDALALLNDCDVFILPSLSEARPRSIIEAMLLGKCVISTKTGGIPTLIEDGVNGFLAHPGNIRELASLLQMVINDPAKRNQIGQAARVHARSMFDINVTIQRYKSLYESLL